MTIAKNDPPGTAGLPFIIERTFNAPRELLWRAWTERDQLVQWFGPKGSAMVVAKMDFRPGGTFLFGQQTPDGKTMWGKFVYREIVVLERIVLIHSFSDENGGITRHPLSPTWPREMLSTTTFMEIQDKTTVALKWEPLNATVEERKTFDASQGSMQQGWKGTFEQMEAYLAKR